MVSSPRRNDFLIIYIDKTIADYCTKNELTTEEKILFNQLAIAHKRGDCFLCGDLSSIEELIKWTDELSSSIYKMIRNKHSEVGSLITLVNRLVILSFSENSVTPDFIPTSCNTYYLIVNQIIKNHLNVYKPCTLIGENLQDCKFYKMMANRYLAINNFHGVSVSCHLEHGGGNTTDSIYNKCVVEDKVPTICIVDSDIKSRETKMFPNHPAIGDTAKRIKKAHRRLMKQTNVIPFDCYCIPIHEIENLIPIVIIERLPHNTEGLCLLKKLLENHLEEAILVYDFKNGINVDMSENSPCAIYWREICEQIEEQDFTKVGNNILDNALRLMEDSSNEECYYKNIPLDDYLKKQWEEIEKIVFSWCCASLPFCS